MGKKFNVESAARDYFCGLISTWSIYEAIKRKELPCVKIGRRILLDEDDLDHWWEQQTAASVQNNNEIQRGVLRRIQ